VLTKLLIATALCLAFISTCHAQEPAASPSPSGPLVKLSLIVTDKKDQGVNTIHKDQIRVRENGVEQTVLSIEADERPVDYVLAIDATGSFQRLLVSALEAATLMVKNRRPDDQVGLVRFVARDNIEQLHEFTTDGDAVIKSLNSMGWEGGQSAIIDALYISAQYVAQHNKSNEGRRKVVIIITDGEERSSHYKEKDLFKLLAEEGVQVFVIGMVMLLDKEAGFTRPSPRLKAEKLLTSIAEESGGRVFFPQNKEELIKSAAEIILDLRAQFRIKYQSTTDATKKGFRKVDVKFVSKDGEKRNLVVPRGYYAGPKDPPAANLEKNP
jgi:Ca-activated chloride channel homolog